MYDYANLICNCINIQSVEVQVFGMFSGRTQQEMTHIIEIYSVHSQPSFTDVRRCHTLWTRNCSDIPYHQHTASAYTSSSYHTYCFTNPYLYNIILIIYPLYTETENMNIQYENVITLISTKQPTFAADK